MHGSIAAVVVALAAALLVSCSGAGSPGAGSPGGPVVPPEHGDGVALNSPAIVRWAVSEKNYDRGEQALDYINPDAAVGPASGVSTDVVVLGRGGSITLDMGRPFGNQPGADLAVWENGIPTGSLLFAELGYVEVSSDGEAFTRFPVSTDNPNPVSGFYGGAPLDPSLYAGFAGLHPAGTGTAFDLAYLRDMPKVRSGQVDLSAIRYVRIVDVVGDGSEKDPEGNPIYDPYPMVRTAGFDLDGVAVLEAP